MLCASMTDIRERLGFDDMTDINFAATMVLDAATPQSKADAQHVLRAGQLH